MPVPRRRNKSSNFDIAKLPSLALKFLDADYMFNKTKLLLLWGFTPTVVLIGMNMEPKPEWHDLINIWD